MKEKDILYENGQYWVCKISNLFYVMKNGITHATSETTAYKDITLAISRVDYLAIKNK